MGECCTDGDPLLLAPGELARAGGGAVEETDSFEELGGARDALSPGRAGQAELVNSGVAVRPVAFGPKRRILAACRDGEESSGAIAPMLEALRLAAAGREPLFPAAVGVS